MSPISWRTDVDTDPKLYECADCLEHHRTDGRLTTCPDCGGVWRTSRSSASAS
ncbi:DUF7129 domain-containing putative zinc-binding protein [Halolamina salifodinae]